MLAALAAGSAWLLTAWSTADWGARDRLVQAVAISTAGVAGAVALTTANVSRLAGGSRPRQPASRCLLPPRLSVRASLLGLFPVATVGPLRATEPDRGGEASRAWAVRFACALLQSAFYTPLRGVCTNFHHCQPGVDAPHCRRDLNCARPFCEKIIRPWGNGNTGAKTSITSLLESVENDHPDLEAALQMLSRSLRGFPASSLCLSLPLNPKP